jgi:rhodanese-related sulfurtransferase
MKKIIPCLTFVVLAFQCQVTAAQPTPSKVDFRGFVRMSSEVREYRKDHLVNLDKFNELAGQKNTIILDTRSASDYQGKHLKGALHLNFSEFNEEKLARLIPNKNTAILIYCNNNFKDDRVSFAAKRLPLALNIPTFINLYGYGYKNIYELSELVSVYDDRLTFEGIRNPGAILSGQAVPPPSRDPLREKL